MRTIKLAAFVALAVPALALAQSGPNPAVKNGSLDPTVGPTNDPVTAPDDVVRPGGPEGDQPDTTEPARPADVNAAGNTTVTDSNVDASTETRRTTAPTSESKRKPR